MKRYKLLKDLPTFNKGDIFQLDEDSGCLVREKDGVVAYAPYTLEKFNILESEWLEEIPEEYKRWRAELGEVYYIIDGAVFTGIEDNHNVDDNRYSIGNYFKTEEEAQKAANWLKAFAVLRDDTKGFKPDWEDERQKKWGVYYGHSFKALGISTSYDCHEGFPYFATHEDAEASIKNHEREWLVFIGVEE